MPVSPNQTDNFPTFSIKVNDVSFYIYPSFIPRVSNETIPDKADLGVLPPASRDVLALRRRNGLQRQRGPRLRQVVCGLPEPSLSGRTVLVSFSRSALPPPSLRPPARHLRILPASGSKDVSSVLKAVSGDSDDSDASMLKKLNNLAPVVLGLLGAILALLVAVLIVGIVLLRRSPTKGYTEILPTRNVSPSYSQGPCHYAFVEDAVGRHPRLQRAIYCSHPLRLATMITCRKLEFADVFWETYIRFNPTITKDCWLKFTLIISNPQLDLYLDALHVIFTLSPYMYNKQSLPT